MEGKLAASEELGRVKFDKLLQYSKQQLGNISSNSNYWKDKFMKKFAEDWEQMVSYGAVAQYGHDQGQGLHKGYNDLSDINFDDI